MIDISPFLNKLDLLKRYMADRIDGFGSILRVECEFNQTLDVEQILRLYDQAGILFYREQNQQPNARPLSFEEYFNYKTGKIIS